MCCRSGCYYRPKGRRNLVQVEYSDNLPLPERGSNRFIGQGNSSTYNDIFDDGMSAFNQVAIVNNRDSFVDSLSGALKISFMGPPQPDPIVVDLTLWKSELQVDGSYSAPFATPASVTVTIPPDADSFAYGARNEFEVMLFDGDLTAIEYKFVSGENQAAPLGVTGAVSSELRYDF